MHSFVCFILQSFFIKMIRLTWFVGIPICNMYISPQEMLLYIPIKQIFLKITEIKLKMYVWVCAHTDIYIYVYNIPYKIKNFDIRKKCVIKNLYSQNIIPEFSNLTNICVMTIALQCNKILK